MMQRDYYEVLSISRTAGEDEIKRAYRKMAMKFHPDHNPGDAEAEQRFKEAAEAYDVLRDPDKRARYDRFGHAGVQGNGGGGFGSAEDIFAHFSDIFGDLFGFSSASRGPRAMAGTDLRYNLTVSFAQAAKGDEITLSLPKYVTCPDCKGSGAAPGSKVETCRQCNGTGQVRRSQGFFQIAMPCPVCQGTGQMITKTCAKCRGEGIVTDTRELVVRVPAGVDTGTRLRVRGEGEAGVHGGPPGDLYVVLTVEQDKRWQRQGQDLIYNQEVSFVQAALGHKVEVPGINGDLPLEIPRGVQSGTLLRLSGEGLPYPGRKQCGDLLVEIKVLTPTRLSAKQEELLREFEKAGEQTTLGKVKKAAKKISKAMGLD
ncbi:molecular chaperone DnaJ [uncultured Desulfovibrio sp.]|uniref:molecular chaperone DnaJ n=1 Tax=uncultured Desulfovibrio sp. TaxID=167968 RepID=UPI002618CA4A|nr:molecular chaperone DnaJ [uncultured Desulfovibrio sp.]